MINTRSCVLALAFTFIFVAGCLITSVILGASLLGMGAGQP